ncbi:hypothetical protein [Ruania alba]|uniref:Uncharacterized protein n=1 Tax=Ruania alba TaxID=648782 RepID=A0A1H5N5T2_9MICO|nr:hypothetical protein [Ruania alba]SEE96028.1 hypothetical protein SAMN04488554_3895 [Ruania alba]
MTSRTRRIVPPVVAVLSAALFAAGCAGEPGAAAVVNGETISESELAETTEALAPFLNAEVGPDLMLATMIQAPVLLDVAAEHGVAASVDETETYLDGLSAQAQVEAPESYPAGAIEVARFLIVSGELGQSPDAQAIGAAMNEQMAELDVEISPRYGSWDPELAEGSAIAPAQHDWLLAPAAPPEQG